MLNTKTYVHRYMYGDAKRFYGPYGNPNVSAGVERKILEPNVW